MSSLSLLLFLFSLEVCDVLLHIGELLAAVLSKVPRTKARLMTEVTELELTLATVDPVIIVSLGLILSETRKDF